MELRDTVAELLKNFYGKENDYKRFTVADCILSLIEKERGVMSEKEIENIVCDCLIIPKDALGNIIDTRIKKLIHALAGKVGKPEDVCNCGHITNVSPSCAIAVDSLAPLICAKCHKPIKLLATIKPQEQNKIEELPKDVYVYEIVNKVNEIIRRVNKEDK